MTGFFDSGVGGIAILKAFLERDLDSEVVYIAINGGGMIGSKTHESIMDTTKFAIEYLDSQECSDVYLACNTASANTLIDLDFAEWKKSNYPKVRVHEIVTPTINYLQTLPKTKKITILATPSTINSNIYPNNLPEFSNIVGLPTVLLARAVEDMNYESVRSIIHDLFLANFNLINDTDVIVLSCTHYIWVQKTINEVFEKMFDYEPEIIAQNKICFVGLDGKLEKLALVEEENSIYLVNKTAKVKIVTTDGNLLEFAKKAQKLLNQ